MPERFDGGLVRDSNEGKPTSGKETSHDKRLLALIVAARFRDRAIADMRVRDCLYVWERV